MDFSSAAHELYGVAPDDFIETRKRLTREAKDEGDAALAKRIGALRRPSLPAWAVNLLSRSAGEELGRLLDVGAEMRSAWSSGGSIGGLEQRRGELVGLLVRRAGELAADAGHPLREQAVREVEDTLQAATVDEDAANDVREGRLDRPRSHTGFVPAGFPTAPSARPAREQPAEREEPTEREEPAKREKRAAEPGRGAKGGTGRTAKARGRQAAGPEADRAAEERARKARERAESVLAEREERVSAAREEVDGASAEVGRLRHELERARARRDTAERRLERAEQARDRAAEDVRGKRGKAARAGGSR